MRRTSTSARSRGSIRFAATLAGLVGWLAVALPASAQRKQVELTPSLGFQFGGDYEYDDFDYGFTRLGVDPSESLGVTLDLPLSRRLQIELLVAQQDTTLDIEEGVGELDPDDVKLEFFHAGVLYQGTSGQVRPFGVVTIGATRIGPGITRLEDEYKPSFGLGAGVKLMLSEHFGFRLEGRLLATVLDEYDDDRCCFDDFCCDDRYSTTLVQGRLSVGAILAF